MYCLIVDFILISIISIISVICQQTGLQSDVRITRAGNCNMTGLKWNFDNITVSYIYPRSFLNMVLNVTEETKQIKKALVYFDRCNDQGFDCEDFQTWYFDNFCPMLNWKNQLWSNWTDALRPKFRCPVRKNIYVGRNITFDYNAFTRWYPESIKYHWKINVKILNERSELVLCVDFDVHVYQYRKRNRKS
ncbi:uncharacterized protein LOC135844845 [Planococcus citri]|uniref:uncharacterized protein LOC135844845 n=1 Tax=Planococcus citri TaxID=170843 RepID=UPI0031F7B019